MNYSENDDQRDIDDIAVPERKSRTAKKKEALSLQKLGESLLKLSEEQLEEIELSPELNDALKFAKTLNKHGALRRQMQYIGTLMREIDSSQIQEALDRIRRNKDEKTIAFKETEIWRDQLMGGDKKLMEEILSKYPDADRQRLMQLIRNAIKEKENDRPPRATRILFRYLREIKRKD